MGKYELRTDIYKDGKIIQSLIKDKVEVLSRWVCDIREVEFRDALIKLGWTPPIEEAEVSTNKGRCDVQALDPTGGYREYLQEAHGQQGVKIKTRRIKDANDGRI